MDEMAVRELVRELVEDYLPGQRRSRMEAYRAPKAQSPEAGADEAPEALPQECLDGTCEHLEHARDDELEGL